MEDVRLYLEGQLVDIDPNTKIAENKQVATFFSLQERGTSFTQMFNVLLTKETLRVLDNAGKPYSTSKKPYGAIDAQLYRGSTATVVEGSFYIKEIKNIKDRETAIVRGNIMDGNIDLFNKLGDKTLASLDFSSINHQLSKEKVEDRKNNNWSRGYIYASADYGYTGKLEEQYRYIPPSLYIKWLFNKIFEDNGFTFEYLGSDNVFEKGHFQQIALTAERTPINFIPEKDKKGNELPIDYAPSVDFGKLFTTTKQKDIILDVCRMYGLIFKKDKIKNHYYFISVNELFTLKNAVDYSDKLKGTNTIKYSFGNYAQNNWFRWSYDDDKDRPLDGAFTILNNYLNNKANVVESKFKVIANDNSLMPYLEYTGNNDDGTPKLKHIKTKPYIINVSGNGAASNKDLSWGWLIDKYYERLVKAFKHQEFREVEMELTAQDVKNFDFFKLVYLRQYQAYYYCCKIKNYTGNKTTKVELIRVSEIEP